MKAVLHTKWKREAAACALFALCLLFFPTGASLSAADFWVDAGTGDDTSGNGTKAFPWKTLTQALAATAPGDTIHARGTLSASTGERFPLVLADRNIAGEGIDQTVVDSGNLSDTVYVKPAGPAAPPSLRGLTIHAGTDFSAVTIFSLLTVVPADVEGCSLVNSRTGILVRTDPGDCADAETEVAAVRLRNCFLSGNKEAVVGRTDGPDTRCELDIVNNTFVGNETAVKVTGAPTVQECYDDPVLTECDTCSTAPLCRLATCCEKTLLTLDNNIIALNMRGVQETGSADTCPVSVKNNDFFSNVENYSDWASGAITDVNQVENATGNFSADPLFLDGNGGDFHINENSPCRDVVPVEAPAGTPREDIDNQSRPWGAGFDIGADEVALTDIRYFLHSVSDSCPSGGAGRSGFPEPGETIDIDVMLRNLGHLPSRNITAEISTADSFVRWVNTHSDYNDLMPMSQGENLTPFRLVLARNTTCPHTVTFNLDTVSAEGRFYSTFAIDVPSSCVRCDNTADLSFFSYVLVDRCPMGGGGGDARPDPGETVEMTVFLSNRGPAPASDLTAILETTNPAVKLPTSRALAFDDLFPGRIGPSREPYVFNIDGNLPCPAAIRFDVDITSFEGDSADSFPLVIPTGCTPCPPPDLGVEQVDFADFCPSGGASGDGGIDPGEDIGLGLSLHNASGTDAASVVAEVVSLVPGIAPSNGALDFPVIPAGETRGSSVPYSFLVPEAGTQCGDDLFFQVDISSGARTFTDFISLPVAADCTACARLEGECTESYPVQHADWRGNVGRNGSYDLRGTAYEATAVRLGGRGPEIRFWEYQNFANANSGLEDQHQQGGEWLLNSQIDIGDPFAAPGSWCLVNADWQGPRILGCPGNAPDVRTVVEMSFVDALQEGTAGHRTLYAVAAVPYDFSRRSYNLDRVANGVGPFGNRLPVAPVPVPQPRSDRGVTNALDPGMMDIMVELADAVGYSDTGTVNLIAGTRLLYLNDPATASGQPESSGPAAYLPVRIPADPTRALDVIPSGTPTALVTVPIPQRAAFLTAQIVYNDATAEILSRGVSGHSQAVLPPQTTPQVTDLLSVHCTSIAPPDPPLPSLLPLTPGTADYALPGLAYPGTATDTRGNILSDASRPLVFYRLVEQGLAMKATKNLPADSVDFAF
jgi:hypothetical protein